MYEGMNALVDKVHKQGMPHNDMHSINMTTLNNNHLCGMPVGTKFTATYVGMHCCIMWPCYGVHITVWHSLLSAIAFIEPSLHHFLEIFFYGILTVLTELICCGTN